MDAWVWILIAVAAVVVIALVASWFVQRRRRRTVPDRFGTVPEVSPPSEPGDTTRSPSSTGRPAMGDDVQSRAGEAAGTTAEKGQEVTDRAKAEASQVTETAKG